MDILSGLQAALASGKTGAPASLPVAQPAQADPLAAIRELLSARQPAGGGGFNWGNALRDIGAGMASTSWQDNPFQAFGKGVSGADASQQHREKAARDKLLQDLSIAMKQEDRTYQRERDAKSDDHWQKQFDATQGDRAYQRGRDAKTDKRAGETHDLSMLTGAQSLMRSLNPSFENLSLDQRINLDKAVSDRLKAMNPNGFSTPEELAPMVEKIRNELLGVKPAATSPAAAPASAGTEADPHKPTDKATFDALPSGAWFINPADGRLLRKQ